MRRLILAACAVLSLHGCKQRSDESTVLASGGIMYGIPRSYLGVADISSGVVTFDAGQSTPQSTMTNQMSIIPGTGGYGALKPMSCATAEAWAKGSSSFASTDLCRVEFAGTGRMSSNKNGVALHIIPLDASGNGFSPTTFKPMTAPLKPGPIADVHQQVKGRNADLDKKAIAQAIQNVKNHFGTAPNNVPAPNAMDCVKNARTAAWSDIQAHYYCLLPYTIRYCFSTVLAEQKNPVKAFTYCSDAANQNDWNNSRDSMFAPYAPGHVDWSWLIADQGDIFKHLMFSQQGVNDFNIEAQNDVINSSYGSANARPRRAVDTYPQWFPVQPRYDDLRAGVSPTAPTPPGVPTPSAPPVSNTQVLPKVGTYAEMQSLESITCTAKVTGVQSTSLGVSISIIGGSGCTLNGKVFSSGIQGSVVCNNPKNLADCRYSTTLANLTPFVRDAELKNGQIIVKSQNSGTEFIWGWISP